MRPIRSVKWENLEERDEISYWKGDGDDEACSEQVWHKKMSKSRNSYCKNVSNITGYLEDGETSEWLFLRGGAKVLYDDVDPANATKGEEDDLPSSIQLGLRIPDA